MSLAGCPPIASPRLSGQRWMGPSIVPKLAIAPVFTAFTVCAVINFGVVEPGTRTVEMTRSARGQRSSTTSCGEQRAHAIAQYRVDAAQRLGIAVEYRDIGAHAARLLHCIQKTQPVFEFTAQSVAPRL
jgi:hypothetical protein